MLQPYTHQEDLVHSRRYQGLQEPSNNQAPQRWLCDSLINMNLGVRACAMHVCDAHNYAFSLNNFLRIYGVKSTAKTRY
jgi:hypothetical protein